MSYEIFKKTVCGEYDDIKATGEALAKLREDNPGTEFDYREVKE